MVWFLQLQKSSFKLERNKDLTFILIIINWYENKYRDHFWAISPSPTLECYKLIVHRSAEVAKTKVSKPKRYYLSKLRFCHAPLKRLIQARPTCLRHCGNICIMQPKCSRKVISRGFSSRSSVEVAITEKLFLAKSTLYGLPKVDAFRNH